MNKYLIIAAVLCFALGAIHSILGEKLIFRVSQTSTAQSTLTKYKGIIWASWHLVTFLGFALGVVLLQLAGVRIPGNLVTLIGLTMFIGAVLVFVGTQAKHPGWVVLLAIAILCWLAGV